MTPKKLWPTAFILLLIHMIIQYVFYMNLDLTKDIDIYIFVLEFIGQLTIAIIAGLLLGVLIAFIPFKQKRFKEKVKTTVPLLTSFVLLVFISVFGYSIYLKKVKGIDLRPLNKYEDISIPANINCSMVRSGKFESDKTFIERIENKQIQTDKKTGEKKEFTVEWINDCEYVLTSTKDSLEIIRVKITEVNPNGYGCYVISDKKVDRYPIYLTIKRVK